MGGLTQLLGSLFGYGVGTGSNNAAGQLAGQGVTGPATPDLRQEQTAFAQQQDILSQLKGMAAGTGPSAAQGQLSQAIQQAIASQGAAAAGGRYGQNAANRQTQVANTAANLEGAGANAAGNLRAQEMQTGAQGAANVSGAMAGEGLNAAALGEQGQMAYNNQLAGLYGAEQGQQAQGGMNLQSSLLNAAGGALGQVTTGGGGGSGGGGSGGGGSGIGGALTGLLGSMEKGGVVEDHHMTGMKHLAEAMKHFHMAHGGHIDTPGETLVGEKGPELLASTDPHQKPKTITHPSLLRLGAKGRDVVLPLEKDSAPYHPSASAHAEPRPETPAPKHPHIKREAVKALDGEGKVHSPGPGADGLSPKTKPVVEKAMKAGGINPAALAKFRAMRAHQHKAE